MQPSYFPPSLDRSALVGPTYDTYLTYLPIFPGNQFQDFVDRTCIGAGVQILRGLVAIRKHAQMR